MSVEENKAVVQRYLEEFVNQKNLAVFDELVADDGGMTCGGVAARFEGRESIRDSAKAALSAFPNLQLRIDEVVAEGDKVVVRWTGRGNHEGDFLGIEPTGQVVPVSNVEIYELENGKIKSIRVQPDILPLVERLPDFMAAAQRAGFPAAVRSVPRFKPDGGR
jgi:steroid delta-isomerase-like uncharacterized protein